MINNNSYNYNNIHGKKAKLRNKNYGQSVTSIGCIFFTYNQIIVYTWLVNETYPINIILT